MPLVTLDPDASEAPYAQVRDQLRTQVDSGALPPGTRLPPVRALATELGLAANTVARAYRELEGLGAIETRGRAGSVVTGAGAERSAREAAGEFATRMRDLGIDREQALELARRALG